MSAVTDVKITRVGLVEQSTQTYRALNGGDPALYPVKVWFSQPLDDFERMALSKWWDYEVEFAELDRMVAILLGATLEQVRDQMGALNGKLSSAMSEAARTRDAAEAEDARLMTLAAEINEALSQQ